MENYYEVTIKNRASAVELMGTTSLSVITKILYLFLAERKKSLRSLVVNVKRR